MSYNLGLITLPTPKRGDFTRRQIETGAGFMTLDGTTKKDITNRKEQYVLSYELLTQAEISSILSEYDLQTTRDFSVNETNLTIASTPVHIDIKDRRYNTAGDSYREDLTLILTEVV